MEHMDQLDPNILNNLQNYIRHVNPYVSSFQAAIDLSKTENNSIILHHDKKSKQSNEYCRQCNRSMNSEVVALVPGDIKDPLDVIIHCQNAPYKRINSLHRSFDPLYYVLLFPEGTDGWRLNLKKTNGYTLTAMDFYAYQLQVRINSDNHGMRSRRLLQQYALDQWAKVERSGFQ
ncbi:Hypothetical predicted protein [Octopus vulgaris]|uniref:Helitron helicase-like domain-containing protein n=1 Tax=Octopus vulgaris TaxID=6645 RepID=A0AA36AJS1_OCTVU|nr:Hypothetical predicted protein [Octopus vulgaris]